MTIAELCLFTDALAVQLLNRLTDVWGLAKEDTAGAYQAAACTWLVLRQIPAPLSYRFATDGTMQR